MLESYGVCERNISGKLNAACIREAQRYRLSPVVIDVAYGADSNTDST